MIDRCVMIDANILVDVDVHAHDFNAHRCDLSSFFISKKYVIIICNNNVML